MKQLHRYSILIVLLFYFMNAVAQNHDKIFDKKASYLFTIRGSVRERDTYEPISKVNIVADGGAYTMTSIDGSFMIRARKVDELMICHKDFETVYYTIVNNEYISVEVESIYSNQKKGSKPKTSIKSFNALIDSISQSKR